MSTYYMIRTKITVDKIDEIPGLSIELHGKNFWIRDKYNNTLICDIDSYNRIIRLKRYGNNDYRFILYQLIIEAQSLFIYEHTDLEYTHRALENEPLKENVYVIDYGFAFEDETVDFINRVDSLDLFKGWVVKRPDIDPEASNMTDDQDDDDDFPF